MPRSGTLIGSLKSLFKPTRNGSQKPGASPSTNSPHAALGSVSSDASASLPPFSDVFGCQPSTALESAKDDGAPAFSTCSLPKSFPHKFLSRNSNSFSPSRSPLSVSEATVCHSLSDPCDQGKNDKAPRGDKSSSCVVPTRRVDGVRIPPKTSRLLMDTRGGSPLMPSADTTPPGTTDHSRRCLSLDIPASSLTSPATFGKQPPLLHAVLSAKDPSLHNRSPEVLQSKSMIVTSDMLQSVERSPQPESAAPAAPPAAPSVPKTTLLALCQGVPAAMRRGQWCVEDYEVTRRIYKGASSTVYKAICRQSGMPVALKVYFLSKVPKNVVHMIVREIKIHIALVHKNVVMLYAAFQDENRLVLVQEYAGRGDLYGIYRSLNRRMSETQLTCLVLGPFMEALSYLHSRGICHRDIKPENILFTTDWRLIVADFGVSIDLNEERAVTRAGTLEYMAPEVERCPLKMLPEENKENDEIAYTTAVDIWAVGVLAYELLVGFPPFVGDRMAIATGSVAMRSSVRRALSFPAGTSPNARDFISGALAEAPEERPTALELSRHPWLSTAVQQLVRV